MIRSSDASASSPSNLGFARSSRSRSTGTFAVASSSIVHPATHPRPTVVPAASCRRAARRGGKLTYSRPDSACRFRMRRKISSTS